MMRRKDYERGAEIQGWKFRCTDWSADGCISKSLEFKLQLVSAAQAEA
jgi:hypothetical protein